MPGREDPNDVKSLPGTDASTKVPSDLGQPGRRSIKSIVLRDLPLLGLVVVGLVVLAVIAMRDLPTIEAGGDTDVEESTDESSPETTEGEEEAAGPSEPEEDPDQDSAAASESESEGADDEGESQSEAGEETEADEVPEEGGGVRLLTDGFAFNAAARGIPIVPWTINETADFERLELLDPAGINTDYPERLVQYLG